jgi:hypothetical protein
MSSGRGDIDMFEEASIRRLLAADTPWAPRNSFESHSPNIFVAIDTSSEGPLVDPDQRCLNLVKQLRIAAQVGGSELTLQVQAGIFHGLGAPFGGKFLPAPRHPQRGSSQFLSEPPPELPQSCLCHGSPPLR